MINNRTHSDRVPELPKGLAAFRQFLSAIGRIELVLAITALLIVVILSGTQTFLRYSIDASLWWAQEVAETTIMIAYFFGISYVFKTRQYILIEFLCERAPVKIQLYFYLIAQMLSVVFGIAILYLFFLSSNTLMNMRTPVLGLSAVVPSTPLAIASAMLAFTSLYYLAFAIWALINNLSAESMHEIEAIAVTNSPEKEPM